jgi:hypothetical protein
MLKIRVVSNYAESWRLHSEILRQFAPANIVLNFGFVEDNSYNILFILNNWDGEIKVKPEYVFVLAQEPSWSLNFKDWNDKCAEFISPTNNQLPLMFNWTGLDFEEAINLKIEKTKKCSFIVAKHKPLEGTLYDFRNKLVDLIIASDLDIDIYGKGWNISDSRYKGEIEHKKDGLIDYHSSICIENCEQEFYVTEKFWDAIICDTFPIPYQAIKNEPIKAIKAIMESVAIGDGYAYTMPHKQYYFHELNIFRYIQSKVNLFI